MSDLIVHMQQSVLSEVKLVRIGKIKSKGKKQEAGIRT